MCILLSSPPAVAVTTSPTLSYFKITTKLFVTYFNLLQLRIMAYQLYTLIFVLILSYISTLIKRVITPNPFVWFPHWKLSK